MTLRKFLSWSYKNTNEKRSLYLRRRLNQVMAIDRELERGFQVLKEYTKHGDFWYNCVKSPEKFWYIN